MLDGHATGLIGLIGQGVPILVEQPILVSLLGVGWAHLGQLIRCSSGLKGTRVLLGAWPDGVVIWRLGTVGMASALVWPPRWGWLLFIGYFQGVPVQPMLGSHPYAKHWHSR